MINSDKGKIMSCNNTECKGWKSCELAAMPDNRVPCLRDINKNIVLPEKLKYDLDIYAKLLGMPSNAFVRVAIMEKIYLEKERER